MFERNMQDKKTFQTVQGRDLAATRHWKTGSLVQRTLSKAHLYRHRASSDVKVIVEPPHPKNHQRGDAVGSNKCARGIFGARHASLTNQSVGTRCTCDLLPVWVQAEAVERPLHAGGAHDSPVLRALAVVQAVVPQGLPENLPPKRRVRIEVCSSKDVRVAVWER